jgi:hypothetical protein
MEHPMLMVLLEALDVGYIFYPQRVTPYKEILPVKIQGDEEGTVRLLGRLVHLAQVE